MKILTIDDERNIRKSIRYFLEDCGFEVVEAENGREGIDLYKKDKPDLVLVDLRMPEIDGLQVLSDITKNSPDLPIIVVSGAGAIRDVVEALRLGAWDYVLKPINDMEVIKHTILKALERAKLKKQNKEYQVNLEETLSKLRDDEKAGRTIQMKLLPPKQSVLGPYTFSQYLMPSMYLSGDFVDYFYINDDCIAFYTADVSGHGVSSALVTVLLKSFMRKYVEKYHTRNDYSIFHPGPLLTRLNTELINENLEKYVTLFYGILICPENSLRYASAGQFPSPIIWKENNKPEIIQSKGKPIALFPKTEYPTHEIKLPDKFSIAIFSDGILEVLPENKISMKIEYLKSMKSKSELKKFVSKVKTKQDLPDDVTILTISKGDESNV